MTQYNILNVKLSNSQLNKLKSGIKNSTEVTLNLSSNIVGESNGETNFSHELLLTNTQISKICKAFANSSSANIKFSKTQLCKAMHLVGFSIPGPFNLLFDKINNLFFKASLEVPDILNKIKKGENILGTLLDAGYNIVNNKDALSLLKGSGITLTNNEIKDEIFRK